jgi:putative DNA primase/helicase
MSMLESKESKVTSIRRKVDAMHYALAQAQNDVPRDTDRGNAMRMCRLHGKDIHYVDDDRWPSDRRWYVWDGARWNPNYEVQMREWYTDVVKSIYLEIPDEPDRDEQTRLFRHARRSEGAGRYEGMLGFLKAEQKLEEGIRIAIAPTLFDADPYLFNCANGTIDLRTGELLPHRRNDLITKCSPVEYDSNATSELWATVLNAMTNGDKEFELNLQRASGLSLIGNNLAEKFFYVLGTAATGKSTFVTAMLSVMGDYGAVADVQSFLKHRHTGLSPRDDLFRLMGVRQIVTSETPGGASFETSLMKQATGGDIITARPLYGKNTQFRLGTIWMHANHAANIPLDDEAMYRRLCVLPFDHVIPAEQRDPQVKVRLCDVKECGPAILAWRVQGCLMYQREGLVLSRAVQQASLQYRAEMNPLHEWQIERLEIVGDASYETVKDVYEDYELWADENKIDPRYRLNKNKFGRAMKAMGIEQISKWLPPGRAERVWPGVRLTEGESVMKDSESLMENPDETLESVMQQKSVMDGTTNENNELPF